MSDQGLDLRELRKASVKRCEQSFGSCGDWSPADWSNAMAGEAGELLEVLLPLITKVNSICNLTKKVQRGDEMSMEEIGKEIADVVIYADLLSHRLGIDLSDAVRKKFDEVSARVGSDVLLGDQV
jgi:NTP pyrophosphatase (non-canonical NTP hydrolase)